MYYFQSAYNTSLSLFFLILATGLLVLRILYLCARVDDPPPHGVMDQEKATVGHSSGAAWVSPTNPVMESSVSNINKSNQSNSVITVQCVSCMQCSASIHIWDITFLLSPHPISHHHLPHPTMDVSHPKPDWYPWVWWGTTQTKIIVVCEQDGGRGGVRSTYYGYGTEG